MGEMRLESNFFSLNSMVALTTENRHLEYRNSTNTAFGNHPCCVPSGGTI